MKFRTGFSLLIALGGLPTALDAQAAEKLRAGVVFERVSFADSYVIESLSQQTFPVAFDISIGTRAALVLSTGFVAATMRQRDSLGITVLDLSSPLDTELRLDVQLVPGRLVAIVAGTLPTGRQTILEEELSVLVALANDGVGYSTPTFGSGGNIAGGLSGAIPLGRFALGTAATVIASFPYHPVAGETGTLSPGIELRARVGIEGALAERTYLRLATSLVTRQRDRLNGVAAHGLGQRLVVFGNVEHGLGPVLLGVHVYNVARGRPQLESTALGVAVLPRGNLLVGGATVSVALGAATVLVPSLEYRVAAAAPTATGSELERQASTLRFGAEVRRRIGARLHLVLRGERAVGEVLHDIRYVDLSGSRFGVRVEVSP